MIKTLMSTLAALMLGACAASSTLITSFDSMTSDTVTDKGSYIDQNRVFSLSGSLPQAAPTQLMQYSGKRGVSTGFGISLGVSYIQVKEIPAPACIPDEVGAVRNAITKTRLKALAAVQAQMVLAIEQARPGPSKVDDNWTLLPGLTQEVTSKRSELDSAVETASKVIQKSGLLVVRWSTKAENNSRLAALVNFSGNHSKEVSGYLILAGIREATLFVGDDILHVTPPIKDEQHINWGWHPLWNLIPWFWEWEHDAYTRVTTRTMMTQELAYLQDSESSAALQAQIKASYSELKSLDQSLSELQKIEIEVSLAKASSLSNQGRLANAKWRIIEDPYRTSSPGLGGAADSTQDPNKGDSPETSGQGEERTGFIKGLAALRYSDESAPDHAPGSGQTCGPTCKHKALDLDGWMTVFAVDANFWELQDIFERK